MVDRDKATTQVVTLSLKTCCGKAVSNLFYGEPNKYEFKSIVGAIHNGPRNDRPERMIKVTGEELFNGVMETAFIEASKDFKALLRRPDIFVDVRLRTEKKIKTYLRNIASA